MMLLGHRTVAAPCALSLGALAPVPWPVSVAMGLIVVHSSGWNDLDHKHATASNEFGFISRALSRTVRSVSWLVYLRTRTAKDQRREDAHRGFTHTIEGCLLFAVVVTGVLALVPFVGIYAGWFGFAAFVGTFSHLLGDMCTPSGVPFQITVMRDGKRWQRYAFGLKWRSSGRFAIPSLTVVTIGRRESRDVTTRPGLFRTNSAAEHYIAIPVIWILTGLGCLAVTGTLWPLIFQIIGIDMPPDTVMPTVSGQ